MITTHYTVIIVHHELIKIGYSKVCGLRCIKMSVEENICMETPP